MSNPTVWNRRAALLYSIGTWTILGYVALQSFSFLRRAERCEKKEDEQPQPQPDKEPGFGTAASEDSITETTVYGNPGSGFYVTSTVKYKANFVPYTTRLYNYMQSFFDDSAKKEK